MKPKITKAISRFALFAVCVALSFAFGCGAYGTPPSEMAKIFNEVLSERFYKGAYKKIVFAVLDDRNAHREHNPEGNFKPFCDILQKS